jgi:aquaporin TIP
MENDILRRSAGEFVGTFALVLIGAGAIMSGAELVGVAFAHGLVIAVMVSSLGHITGGHFNPAVTFAFFVTRRIEPLLAAAYWIAQFAGAALAALLLLWIYPTDRTDPTHLGAPSVNDAVSLGAGFVVEMLLTFFLVWVIFATAADPRGAFKSIAGLAIGLTITFDILMGGPLTGAAMNPARAFGPQLVGSFWADGWIYYVAPLLGAALAGIAYDRLYLRPLEPTSLVGEAGSGIDEPRPADAARDSEPSHYESHPGHADPPRDVT